MGKSYDDPFDSMEFNVSKSEKRRMPIKFLLSDPSALEQSLHNFFWNETVDADIVEINPAPTPRYTAEQTSPE